MKRETVQIETITPGRAEALLDTQDNVRTSISTAHVDRIAKAMANGEWTATSMLVISVDGRLIDGQHRLIALIKSNTTQRFPVLRNAPTKAKMNIDTGQSRSVAQIAKASGYVDKYASTLLAYVFYATPKPISTRTTAISKLSPLERCKIFEDNKEYILEVFDAIGTSVPACISGPLFRAYRYYGHNDIEIALNVLELAKVIKEKDYTEARWQPMCKYMLEFVKHKGGRGSLAYKIHEYYQFVSVIEACIKRTKPKRSKPFVRDIYALEQEI